jgi:hypothetical protein
VVGVTPPEDILPFSPVTEGFVRGFILNMSSAFADTMRTISNNFHRLVGPGGSTDAFIASASDDYEKSLRSDLERRIKTSERVSETQDTSLAAYWALSDEGEDDVVFQRFDQLTERQNTQELMDEMLKRTLNATP